MLVAALRFSLSKPGAVCAHSHALGADGVRGRETSKTLLVMWSEHEEPTLPLHKLAELTGKSVAATKAAVEEDWRIRKEKGRRAEIRAAAVRHRQGPRRVREEMGDAYPEIAMSKIRWVELFRASKIERHCKGGELLSEASDFTEWALKRPDMEQCRIVLAKAQNKVGWTPNVGNAATRLTNAAKHGQKERAGRAIFDTERGCWV